VGKSEPAAVYGGISPSRQIIVAMTVSGALAGLMATNELMGVQHRLTLGFTGGYGFVGIAVALMGRNHPLGIVLAAVLFGALYQGGSELSLRHAEHQPRHGRRDPGPRHPVRRRLGEHVPAEPPGAPGSPAPATAAGAAAA
jgi:ABC-type uncharacterized transport system permease subunit